MDFFFFIKIKIKMVCFSVPSLLGGGMNAAITIHRQMENGKQLRFFLFPFVKPCAIINKEHMFYSDWERRTCFVFVFDRMPVAKASVQRRIPRSTGIMPYSQKPDQPGHLPGTAALL